jgi:2-(1,2-epoxy-1,2-dihydrophenyl)acetyl-CoA isomerase
MFDLPHKDGRQATETFMPPSLVLVEQQDAVRTLVLNRPDALNSFNAQLHEQLLSALEQAAGDASVRCVVLTGAGRGFCAGQDLSDPEAAPDQNLGDLIERRYLPLCLRLKSMPVPVVAAVNGVAAGAGANIALACDMVLAAAEAERIGLIWRCVEDADLRSETQALAQRLAAMPVRALARTREAMDSAQLLDYEHALTREARQQGQLGAAHDYQEGVAAFLGKRAPVFSDR